MSNRNLHARVLDIESGIIIWDGDDHPSLSDAEEDIEAAAPTKPWLTVEELEKAFPTFAHGKTIERNVCAICFDKLKEGDKCRKLLPSCIHIFHKTCIDLWLSRHNSCPLCRAVLFL
ncbi:RING-H2 finger protein ATL39-like [Hevea brasiliensis]|uniref:RING-H2 finger protein ATL39-like n=1 Tax=Hevea brasiliensis TaxID=3981 RepID=UPI0025F7E7B0|nr:RING-H2 finger protein ATL39-like [Hevea brasiliensis]